MILFCVGAGMVASSAIGIYNNTPKNYMKRRIKNYFKLCGDKQLEKARVWKISIVSDHEFQVKIVLPFGMGLQDLTDNIPEMELAWGCSILAKHLFGRVVLLRLGYYPFLEEMKYIAGDAKGLAVPLYTPFGPIALDFADETTCHLMVGGATRMGKTVLLRLATTHILNNTKGNVRIAIIDNKVTDMFMFQHIPQIQIAETIDEATSVVYEILEEMDRRKELLKSKGDVVDIREFRKKYPQEDVPPVFLIIDEYGRFSDDKKFQEKIVEIAETAGYLDVHLIIATQRPDATSVVHPRIKANIVTRIAFTTADEANSKLILGIPDAAYLGKIQGRAILLDGFPVKVQVPYLPSEKAEAILSTYKEVQNNANSKGQNAPSLSQEVPGFVSGSDWETDMPTQ